MKAGVTAMLFAYAYVARLRDQLKGKLSLTLVSDEETGYGRGTGFMFDRIESEMEADCVLTAEPSGAEAVVFSSKGYMQFAVRVTTRGAISGYPNESRSAIRIAADIIRELDELEGIDVELPASLKEMLGNAQWRIRHDELAGSGSAVSMPRVTVNVGTVAGGSSASVIAADCGFSAMVVVPVGTDPYLIFSRAREIVGRHPEAEFQWEGAAVADVSDPSDEMAVILQDTVEGLGRRRPEMTPAIAISDCRYWRYRGTPAFWYGPDGSLCSAANESISADELLHVVRTHALAAVRYLTAEPTAQRTMTTEPEALVSPSPEIRTVPRMRVACVATTVKTFDGVEPVVGPMLDKLARDLTVAGATIGDVSLAVFEAIKGGVQVMAAFPVDQDTLAGDGFDVINLPAWDAATTVHRGPTKATGATWDALGRWIGQQGHRKQQAYREVYIVGDPNPDHLWATELQQRILHR